MFLWQCQKFINTYNSHFRATCTRVVQNHFLWDLIYIKIDFTSNHICVMKSRQVHQLSLHRDIEKVASHRRAIVFGVRVTLQIRHHKYASYVRLFKSNNETII